MCSSDLEVACPGEVGCIENTEPAPEAPPSTTNRPRRRSILHPSCVPPCPAAWCRACPLSWGLPGMNPGRSAGAAEPTKCCGALSARVRRNITHRKHTPLQKTAAANSRRRVPKSNHPESGDDSQRGARMVCLRRSLSADLGLPERPYPHPIRTGHFYFDNPDILTLQRHRDTPA